jgi:hypothetical protein
MLSTGQRFTYIVESSVNMRNGYFTILTDAQKYLQFNSEH